MEVIVQGSISPTCLRAAITPADPKSAKRLSSYQCCFVLLGSSNKNVQPIIFQLVWFGFDWVLALVTLAILTDIIQINLIIQFLIKLTIYLINIFLFVISFQVKDFVGTFISGTGYSSTSEFNSTFEIYKKNRALFSLASPVDFFYLLLRVDLVICERQGLQKQARI